MADVVWTKHAEYKMRQYGLSRQRVLGVMRRPERKETGIVPRTVAAMVPVSPKTVGSKRVWRQEIWTLYQERRQEKSPTEKRFSGDSPSKSGSKKTWVISAWRYPGMSPDRGPLPSGILREFEEGFILEEEGLS